MKHINELVISLKRDLKWHKSRLQCFSGLLIALFTVCTVNLRELAVVFQSTAEIDSRYRRLQRFFSGFELDYTLIAIWIYKLFFKPNEKVYLTIDRTIWFWGKEKINIFMLAIAHEGAAIPVFWKLPDGAGNKNTLCF